MSEHSGTSASPAGKTGRTQRARKATTRTAPTDTTPRGEAPAPDGGATAPRLLIRVPLAVRWRDLDAFNHVNNSKYLSFLEEARLQWLLTLPGMGMDDRVAPVVAAVQLNYRRPIEWPAQVDIEQFVERIGTSSLTIGHRILDARDASTLYCDGSVVLVWIDRGSGQAAPLPADVRSAIEGD